MRKWFIFIVLLAFNFLLMYGINSANVLMFNNDFMIYLNKENKPEVPKEDDNPIVEIDTDFNGESIEEIGKKIDNYCEKTPLEGHGEHIARASIMKGVNPYLIGAIILESSKCKTDCSVIFKECNNVSGIKGSPGCFGGAYKYYSSIDDSINEIVSNISKDFYTKEAQTPYKMYKELGMNSSWAFKVNNYMEKLKRGK